MRHRLPALLVNYIVISAYFTSLQLIMSVLARYSRDLGISIAETGVIWSLVYLVSFALRPVAGYLADRTSSYFAMALGCSFLAAASVLYSTSSTARDLIIGRVLQGISLAYFISPSIAAVTTAAPSRVGEALGTRSMLISLAGIAAPPIAGYLVDYVGYILVYLLAAAAAAMSASLSIAAAKAGRGSNAVSRRDVGGWREAANKYVLAMMAAVFANGVIFLSISGILQAHYRDIGYEASAYGYFMMLSGVSSMVSRYLAGRSSEKINPAAIALAGYVVTAASVLMLENTYLVPYSYIVAVIYGVGIGMTIPTQQVIVAKAVSESVRNRAMSIYAMGFDLGGFVGPIILSSIASQAGYPITYRYLVLPASVAAVIMALVARGIKAPRE